MGNRTCSKFLILGSALILTLLSTGCQGKGDANMLSEKAPATPVISEDGMKISFPSGSSGLDQIQTTEVKEGTALISVIAPARVVATIAPAKDSLASIVLFESPDVNTLYSQYRQSRSNVELTSRNLIRVKEMFDNQGATARDLNQAETDAANARAVKAEMDGRLRALGFNPSELGSVKEPTAWLICDVPESDLHEVQSGEDVDIVFSSFPDRKFTGKEAAIGDVVDPATRTVKVRVIIPNPRARFLPGMFARVDFGDPQGGVILLPLNAIVTVEGNDFVFVQTGQREFTRRQVTLASAIGTNTVVRKGIASGEKIVTSGTMLLKGLSFGY